MRATRTRTAARRTTRRRIALGGLLAAGLIALSAGPAAAQSARLRVAVDSVRVGEPFEAVLRVDGSPGGEFLVPRPGPVGDGTVEVLGGAPEDAGAATAGVARESVGVRLAVFALDSADLSLPVAFVVRGETVRVATAPVRVRVARLVTDTTGRLRPTLPPESFGWPPWMWAVLAGALALAAWLFHRWRRRPPVASPVPVADPDEAPLGPHARLVARLTALGDAVPQRPHEARVFFPALADALRQYLAERFSMATREMTTADLVRAVAAAERTGALPRGGAEMLRGVLATTDLGRYGGICPPETVTRDVLTAARALADHLDAPRPPRTPTAAPGNLPVAPVPPMRDGGGAGADAGRSRPWPPVPPRPAPPAVTSPLAVMSAPSPVASLDASPAAPSSAPPDARPSPNPPSPPVSPTS